ncbi:HTH_48 domain-containing protein [Trichonephila clavipes]|nr:HTH_48 domain-containing protein [Trichonephila clavipes]
MKEGLIALNYECSKCNERMGLYERKSAVLDGDFEWVCSTITSQNIYGRTPMILLTMRPSRLFVKIRCHAVASTRKRSAVRNYICWEATDAITEPSDRVYICLRDFKMPLPIENPADCEVRAVIRFLCAQGFKSVDIHHQISEVYVENSMSDGMVRKWVRAFKDGRTNIHDEERSGRTSVIADELILKSGL